LHGSLLNYMSSVPRELIEHELHVDPNAKLVKQCLHCFTQDKKDVIKKEIARLLDTDFIREVYHLDWLANLVLVPKKNKEWRMCVEYTDLNRACKKDHFNLPWIDLVVNSMARCTLLNFLDCYSGYR
jgi:chaperone required for assembly of F1-ATPase